MSDRQKRALTPHFPLYRDVRHYLRILNGVSYEMYSTTWSSIWQQRGDPQHTVNWSDPESWIAERLDGEEQTLAYRLWRESDGHLNPRYMRGKWYLCRKHGLLRDSGELLSISDDGRAFISERQGEVVVGIDAHEGVLNLLQLLSQRGAVKRGDILPDFQEFCRGQTTAQSESVIKQYLYARLMNLIERGYVSRSEQVYEVTSSGAGYIGEHSGILPGVSRSRNAQLGRVVREINAEARDLLAQHLATMNPFKFEELIRFLLEEMGYANVQTTSPTNDKGVDVVADIEVGITSVREVVQVKRHKGSIGRRVLDELRGSLYRFNAMRGTIITTGHFAAGARKAAFEPGGAPITLIDGDSLLGLLAENEIGVKKSTVEIMRFDPGSLAEFEAEEGQGA